MNVKKLAKVPKTTEEFVKISIIGYLTSNGFGTNLKFGNLREKGADIIVKHNNYGRYFIIETKGDGTKRHSSKNEVNFVYGLGQLITRITTTKRGYYYGLGLPEQSANIAIRRIPYKLASELNLHVFSVSDDGKVKVYKPKDIKNHQKI